MKRWWLGTLALGPLVAAIACGDDDHAPGGSAPDSGADGATTYSPPEPVLPLQCAPAGTFDPCDAGLDPSVYGATQPDGGPIENVDAGGYADAGFVPSACVTSGAARIACDDAGAAHFDLAAGAGGISHLVAFGKRASRFEIDPAGAMTTPTAFDARDDELRIVSSAAGVAVLSARSGQRDVYALRDGATSRQFATLGGELQDPPFNGAGMTDDGTIHALYHASGGNFWRQPPPDPKDTSYHPDLSEVVASVLYVGANQFQLAGQNVHGFDVFPVNNRTNQPITIDSPGFGAIFAAGIGPKGPLVAGYDDAAYDTAQIEVFIGHDLRGESFTRVRLQHEPKCQQSGCGYTCVETRRTPLAGGGSFVHLANGKDYFVYGEATVTSERKYSTDYGVVCGLFGGCACLSKTEVKAVGNVDAVVMQVMTDPDQLIERARAHLVVTDPQRTLLDGKRGNGLRATARENQIHVLLQGSGNEMARVVIAL
jgi:hypothetical protein